jgi:cytochrome c peroxidase
MKDWKNYILIGFIAIVGFAFFSFKTTGEMSIVSLFKDSDTLAFLIPEGWPEPHYNFEESPVTKEGFVLGRKLFYDPKLSKDSTISCSNCHLSFTNFTHVDHALSHGIDGRIGNRNTLSIINPAWQKTFMWDGGVNHLEVQPLGPLENPVEMDHSLEGVVKRLKQTKTYPQLYKNAFGYNAEITGQYTLKALAQFMVTFTSANSKYDKVMRKEEGVAFNEREEKGLQVFRKKCASCHQEPLFTNGSFQNNGLSVDTFLNDLGRYNITKDNADSLKFRVPTLRNIEVSYPYMHDGRFKSLQMVLFHYTSGISKSSALAMELKKPLNLTEDDKRNLIYFMKTLTDMEFLRNKDFAFPRN